MNTNKPTPGPWVAKKDAPALPNEIFTGTGDADTEERIAIITGRLSESEANARLIAAAPEMLEALKACAEHMHWSNPPGEAALTAARAAIAKAAGEAA